MKYLISLLLLSALGWKSECATNNMYLWRTIQIFNFNLAVLAKFALIHVRNATSTEVSTNIGEHILQ